LWENRALQPLKDGGTALLAIYWRLKEPLSEFNILSNFSFISQDFVVVYYLALYLVVVLEKSDSQGAYFMKIRARDQDEC